MRTDPHRLEREIAPLLTVRGLELVSLEWSHGRGRGLLRIFVDRPSGDPRKPDPANAISLDEITDVTRDVSSTLDALDLIEEAYTLEVGSPGLERPVQKRADFDRFAGLPARVETRDRDAGRAAFDGVLRGTADLADGAWAARIEVAGKTFEIASEKVVRARLHEVLVELPTARKPFVSRRQERLAARERARAVNAAHLASNKAGDATKTVSGPQDSNGSASAPHMAHEAER